MERACRAYRPRNPRQTPLWGLLDTLYERVKGEWEERFERKYGFWRGLADEAVARYLDCGVWDNGFARVRCRKCPEEFLVAFSCKGRGLCPSCGAKRAAEVAAFLIEEVAQEVGHAQWVFTMPKMLRVYFLHHRELLGELSRAAAAATVKELVAAAGAGPVDAQTDARPQGPWTPANGRRRPHRPQAAAAGRQQTTPTTTLRLYTPSAILSAPLGVAGFQTFLLGRVSTFGDMHAPVPEVGRWLGAVLRGHFNYYGVPQNYAALETFRYHVFWLWWRTLRRRSQKTRLTWERMRRLVRCYLPPARITHLYPNVRLRLST